MKKYLLKAPDNTISRRSFLLSSAGAGIAAVGLGNSLFPTTAKAAPKKRGGSVRVAKGHGSTSDTLDPGTYASSYMIAVSYGINGFLTGVGTDGQIEPELAEDWEASEDAKSWRFKLRDGVVFHNGKMVTADDVIASINFHRKEDSTSAAKPLLEGIVDIRVDGHGVIFELSAGNADFPFTFTDYHLSILPAHDGEIDWRSGIGCGPYKLVSYEPGVVTRLVRNHEDWNQDRGWFEEVELLSIVDNNARTTALISGDVHAVDKLDLKTAGLMERNPDVKIHSVAGNQHFTFAMSTNQDPFTNQHVRLALKYGINRQELVDKILFGYGNVGNDHPIGRGQRYFNDELEQREFDPDRAMYHLEQAGMDGLSVELAAADAGFPGAVDAAVLFQASAAQAGIDLDVKRVPNDGYWADVWMKHPFTAVYWGGRPVEDAMLSTAYSSGAAWNDTFWENERFNALLVSARAELDEAKRRDMYFEMQAILNEDGGAVIPMFANYVFATGPGISTGDQFSSHWEMDGERWMERWSFA